MHLPDAIENLIPEFSPWTSFIITFNWSIIKIMMGKQTGNHQNIEGINDSDRDNKKDEW